MNSKKDFLSIKEMLTQPGVISKKALDMISIIRIMVIVQALIFYTYFIFDGILFSFQKKHYFVICFSALTIFIVAFVSRNYRKKKETRIQVKKDVFTCPHCLKNIPIKNIDDVVCPYCDAENLTFDDAINGCPHCHDPIKLLKCPHCESDIDLEAPYDVIELKGKRYEKI